MPGLENCIFEQLVLCRVGINLSSMAHIHVDHSILGGTRLLRADEEVDATTADPSMAELLGVPKREPLLRVRQVIYSTKGVVILYVLGLYRSDRHNLLIRRYR